MRSKVMIVVIGIAAVLGIVLCKNTNGSQWFRIGSQKEGESGLFTSQQIVKKKAYLTFDDGPSKHTDQILDILKKNDVKATFFVVGNPTKEAKRKYQRIVAEGHTLGMHAYEHNYKKIYGSVDAFSKDLQKLQNYLYKITKVKSIYYRFPGGSSNSCVNDIKPYIRKVKSMGLYYYDWNALSGDAVDFTQSPEELNNNILKDAIHENNTIILMHDLGKAKSTVKGLDSLIRSLKDQGYEILPITESTKEIQHVSVDK
ncbi:MAG: polysaccharide deacetylase [Anaerostipes sp.]|nr:polysaccharide deacetylase [Anaerostipes sp.]